MYIKKLVIENVKSFSEEHIFHFTPGLNFLVGDNNAGKSTVFEAMLFLLDGLSATRGGADAFYCNKGGPTRVTADIAGPVHELVATAKFAKLAPYILTDEDGVEIFRLQRSSEERQVTQGSRKVNLDVKKICFWSPGAQQFENATGIDALAKAVLDLEPVWADASPADYMDFGTTKTLGRLLNLSFTRFAQTDRWKSLEEAHKNVFAGDENDGDSFTAHTKKLTDGLQDLMKDQYGEAEIRFGFEFPGVSLFMKMGDLLVKDGFGETPITGKGTGMQRALALGVIQLYARSERLVTDEAVAPTPLILLIDEPETWLHPNAQLRLADALVGIAKREQVFIATHSPYLIRKFNARSDHRLLVFTVAGNERSVTYSEKMGMLGPGEPSWGEINYRAFGICSHEFHNELYGYVQKHLDTQRGDGFPTREKDVDSFFQEQGFARSKVWKRAPSGQHQTTLPIYVRNHIHHPENDLNDAPSETEFQASTQELVNLVERLRLVPTTPSP